MKRPAATSGKRKMGATEDDDENLEMQPADQDGVGGDDKMAAEADEGEGEDDTREESAAPAKHARKRVERSDEEKEVQASLPKLENYRAAWLGMVVVSYCPAHLDECVQLRSCHTGPDVSAVLSARRRRRQSKPRCAGQWVVRASCQ